MINALPDNLLFNEVYNNKRHNWNIVISSALQSTKSTKINSCIQFVNIITVAHLRIRNLE